MRHHFTVASTAVIALSLKGLALQFGSRLPSLMTGTGSYAAVLFVASGHLMRCPCVLVLLQRRRMPCPPLISGNIKHSSTSPDV